MQTLHWQRGDKLEGRGRQLWWYVCAQCVQGECDTAVCPWPRKDVTRHSVDMGGHSASSLLLQISICDLGL